MSAAGTHAPQQAEVIVVGAGLAGLVATAELVEAGRRVILVDQEGEQGIGGQAFWSFGGLFLVDSPQQRRLGIKDSVELAWQDWQGSAQFDREEDHWPRRWAEAYVNFAAGEKQSWLRGEGHSVFPVVGWAERGGALAGGHGNSVPRFHITWGTGPGIVEPFERIVRAGHERGLVQLAFRHRVDGLVVTGGAVTGVRGSVLAPTSLPRAEATSREVFEKGGVGDDLPTVTLTAADIGDGIANTALFVKAGLSPSGKEAKRLFASGGASINDEVVKEPRLMTPDEFAGDLKLSAGKKRHALVKIAG